MTVKQRRVTKRDEQFLGRTPTRIWEEIPSPDNPYLAERCRCHGYDIQELADKRSFVDVLFLLFQGELPTRDQARLLESLMILCINPGPRHPSCRATMNAGVSRTYPTHFLPIGLSVLGGSAATGAEEVTRAMHFLRKNIKNSPSRITQGVSRSSSDQSAPPMSFPGFGSRFGGADPFARRTASHLLRIADSPEFLCWGDALADLLTQLGQGWLLTGVAAAVLCDLGFHPRAGAGLFQLMCAPGILAHGLELANKPITAMPFLDEDHYVIAPEAQKP